MSESLKNSLLVHVKPSLPEQRESANLTKRGLADLRLIGRAETLFKQAMMYRRRKQHEKGFQFLQRALSIDSQHLEARTWIGISYSNGRGVERDQEKALQYFREAAELGHAHAQFCLGLSYANGEGIDKDLIQAANWFRKAAEQGNEGAQWELALLLYHGTDGCEDEDAGLKNRREAAIWFQKAAEQDSRDAAGNERRYPRVRYRALLAGALRRGCYLLLFRVPRRTAADADVPYDQRDHNACQRPCGQQRFPQPNARQRKIPEGHLGISKNR